MPKNFFELFSVRYYVRLWKKDFPCVILVLNWTRLIFFQILWFCLKCVVTPVKPLNKREIIGINKWTGGNKMISVWQGLLSSDFLHEISHKVFIGGVQLIPLPYHTVTVPSLLPLLLVLRDGHLLTFTLGQSQDVVYAVLIVVTSASRIQL